MFKGKKSLYILLPINLLVWGFIGYKIVLAFQPEDLPIPVDTKVNFNANSDRDTAMYRLRLNYEDPFLKQEPVKRSATRQANYASAPSPAAVQVVKDARVKEVIPQKEIKYLGTIQNKTSGIIMALISINGNSYTIKKGDSVEGFDIKNVTASFLEVKEGKKSFKVLKG